MNNSNSIFETQVLETQKLNGSINYKQNTRNWHESEKNYHLRSQQGKVIDKSVTTSFFDLSFKLDKEQRTKISEEYYRYGY